MKERLMYIDALRGLAIFLVVLGHILIFNGYEKSIITTTIYSFHMPLFMFISGYVARFSYKEIKNIPELIGIIFRKFNTILLPYIVWCIFVRPLFFQSPLNYINRIEEYGLTSFFLSEYWFLPCLFTLSVCFFLYMLISLKIGGGKFISRLVVLCLLVIIVFLLNKAINISLFTKCLQYIPFYFLGVLAIEYKCFSEKLFKNDYLVCISFAIFTLLNGLYNEVVGTGIVATACRFLCGICSIVFCINIFEKISTNSRLSKILSYIGTNTLGIYLVHFIFVKNWDIVGLDFTSLLLIGILGSVFVIALCLGIIKILRTNKILSFLLLGK